MTTPTEEEEPGMRWEREHQSALMELARETLCTTPLLRQMIVDHEWAYHAAPLLAELFRAVGAENYEPARVLVAASNLHVHARDAAMRQVAHEASDMADDAVRGDA